MKPGDLVMTKRDGSVALVLDDGDMIGIDEGTPALVLDIDVDPLDPYMSEVRVLINGMIGVLWPHELKEPDESR